MAKQNYEKILTGRYLGTYFMVSEGKRYYTKQRGMDHFFHLNLKQYTSHSISLDKSSPSPMHIFNLSLISLAIPS
jgi:hypothetical protein